MTANSNQLVQKLWNFCNVLRWVRHLQAVDVVELTPEWYGATHPTVGSLGTWAPCGS